MYLPISIQTHCATSTVLTNSELLRQLTPKYYVILCQFHPSHIMEIKCILMVTSINFSVFYVKVFRQVTQQHFVRLPLFMIVAINVPFTSEDFRACLCCRNILDVRSGDTRLKFSPSDVRLIFSRFALFMQINYGVFYYLKMGHY
jgi:hypothetical protein